MSNLLIEPPVGAGRRQSTADPKMVERMAAAMEKAAGTTQWITDGNSYPTSAQAGNEAQVYRRALAKAGNVPEHTMRSKVWGTKNGSLLTDRDAKGEWRYALKHDPTRQPRQRRTDGNGDEQS